MKKNKYIIKISLLILTLAILVLPALSFATTLGGGEGHGGGSTATTTTTSCSTAYSTAGGLEGFFNYLTCVLSRSVVPLLFALAFVVFIWGVLQFVMNSGDETKRTQGKQFMIWGLIGLFVMFSVWGLVLIIGNTLNNSNDTTLFIPALPATKP